MLEKYFKMLLAGTLGIFAVSVVSFFDNMLAVGILFVFFLFGFSLILFCKLKILNKKVLTLFFIAIAVHLLFALFIYYFHFYPFGGGAGDQDGYHAVATELAARLHQQDFSLGDALKYGHYYPVVMGYIYALTVSNILIGQILNVWVVALIVLLAYFLALEITKEEKGSFLVGLAVIFYPSLLFYGSLMLKDAFVVLFLISGALLLLKLLQRFSWEKFIVFYLVLAALFNFRFYIGYALLLSFLAFWFLFSHMASKQRIWYGLFFIVILGFLPYCYPGQGYWGVDSMKRYLNKETITMYREFAYTEKNWTPMPETKAVVPNQVAENNPDNPNKTNHAALAGQVAANNPSAQNSKNYILNFIANIAKPAQTNGTGSSFALKTDLNNPFLFVMNVFKSFLYVVLGPLPWQIESLRQIAALFETIPWYVALYFIVMGSIKEMKTDYKKILPVLGLSIMILGVLSVFIANFGVITRIRMPAFILLLCLSPLFFKKESAMYRALDGLKTRFNKYFPYHV